MGKQGNGDPTKPHTRSGTRMTNNEVKTATATDDQQHQLESKLPQNATAQQPSQEGSEATELGGSHTKPPTTGSDSTLTEHTDQKTTDNHPTTQTTEGSAVNEDTVQGERDGGSLTLPPTNGSIAQHVGIGCSCKPKITYIE